MKIEKLNSNSSPKIHNILDKNIVSFSARKNIDKFTLSDETTTLKILSKNKRAIPNVIGIYDDDNSKWLFLSEIQYYPEDVKKIKKLKTKEQRVDYCEKLLKQDKFIIDTDKKEKLKVIQQKYKDCQIILAPIPMKTPLKEIFSEIFETIAFITRDTFKKAEYVDVNGKKVLKSQIPNWAGGWKGEEDEGWRDGGQVEFYPEDLKKMETMTLDERIDYKYKLIKERKYIK